MHTTRPLAFLVLAATLTLSAVKQDASSSEGDPAPNAGPVAAATDNTTGNGGENTSPVDAADASANPAANPAGVAEGGAAAASARAAAANPDDDAIAPTPADEEALLGFGPSVGAMPSEVAAAESFASIETTPQIGAPPLVTMNVRNVAIGQVLEMLSVQHRINIVAGANTNALVTANFYDASLEEALDWVLHPIGLDWRFDGRVYDVQEASVFAEEELPPLKTRVFQPDYMSAAEVERLVAPMLSTRGRVIVSAAPEIGIPSGSDETGGLASVSMETVIVMDDADSLGAIAEFIDELDVPPRQVLVEATILEVRLDETNRFGVDLSLLNGSGLDLDDVSSLTDVFADSDAPISLPDGSSVFGTNGFREVAGDGLQAGFVGEDLAVFLDMLSSITDTNVLANTRVLALNKMRAEIIIGGRLGYNAGTTVSDGISQQNVEFLDVGTQLRFRPFIGRDGRVRLEIHPERSSGIVDPVTQLPTENTSEVTTNVLVHDGASVVIGGLIETRDVSEEKKVPVLGYIPVLGWLFSSEETATQRSEIVVILTVHVLEEGEVYDDAQQYIEEHERDRVHMRDTFGPIARVEHGERTLEDARDAFEAGDLWEARLLCDRALMIDPLGEGVVDLSLAIDAAIDRARADGTWTEDEMEGVWR